MNNPRTALIVVDMQEDFVYGNLAVPGAEEIIPIINKLVYAYPYVVLTRDWHPTNHKSFAKWGAHCVAGTQGANVVYDLDVTPANLIISKGMDAQVESLSAFEDENGKSSGLAELLVANNIMAVDVCGLALGYCVTETYKSAHKAGFMTKILTEASRGFDV